VALLGIKGAPIAEIAALRNTREGTIKAQNAAIYRKAGVSGRADLISLIVEELVGGLRFPRRDSAGAPTGASAASGGRFLEGTGAQALPSTSS
jgi:hypothetical protein